MLHKHNISNALHHACSRVALTLALVIAVPAHSALLSFNVIDPVVSEAALSPHVFAGTITNNTGVDLLASELAFNFSGFGAAVLPPLQLLGNTDFTIADGTTSALTDLFSITLGGTAVVGQSYSIDVFLQDLADNLSDTVTVSIHAIPEPSSMLLLLAGFLCTVLAAGSRRRT